MIVIILILKKGVKERIISILKPILSFLYLYTITSKAKMELIELKKPYIKRLEQPSKGGVKYQEL